ncbi:unnamed protein product [Ostreobium quekettii]|uniref:Armadillo repeat-containing protein 6 n=1 Tax=Ostreobium quekettii TaxID=121088 RepID=A0A8S1ILI7_9CHLO|nr:unnamed protein product [Ostreobium quekettii]|eukprot:evm.model.scf_57.1 EVM.evm.TU.scf_57.1   scf_57:1872-9924(+)
MPSKKISQEAFDELVQENRETFGMVAEEALKSTIEELELQGVCLTGIIKSAQRQQHELHPVSVATQNIEEKCGEGSDACDACSLVPAFEELLSAVNADEKTKRAEALSVAKKAGSVAVVLTAMRCMSKEASSLQLGIEALIGLAATSDMRKAFHDADGPASMLAWVKEFDDVHTVALLAKLAAVVSTKNEANKCKFMDLGFADSLHAILLKLIPEGIPAYKEALGPTCQAFASFTTADDPTPPTSRAMQNARALAQKGWPGTLLNILNHLRGTGKAERSGELAEVMADCLGALRSVALNDDICSGFVREGGVGVLMEFLEEDLGNWVLVKNTCATLRQLASGDLVKQEIIAQSGPSIVYRVLSSYCEHETTVETVLGMATAITLRNPNGSEALAEAGCVDLIVETAKAHDGNPKVLRQVAMCCRNMVVRSPEVKGRFLEQGMEAVLRGTKKRFGGECHEAACAALRDLGFDDYH